MNVDKKTVKRGLLPYLFLFIAMLGIFYFFNIANKKVNVISYDEFVEKLDSGDIKELNLVARASGYTYEARGKLDGYKDNESFYSTLPLTDTPIDRILEAKDSTTYFIPTVLYFIISFSRLNLLERFL